MTRTVRSDSDSGCSATVDLRSIRAETAQPLACKSRADRVPRYVGGSLPGRSLAEVDRVRHGRSPLLHHCYTEPGASHARRCAVAGCPDDPFNSIHGFRSCGQDRWLRAPRVLHSRAVHHVVRAGCGEFFRHDLLGPAARRLLAVRQPPVQGVVRASVPQARYPGPGQRRVRVASRPEHIVHSEHGARTSGRLWASRVSGTTVLDGAYLAASAFVLVWAVEDNRPPMSLRLNKLNNSSCSGRIG